MSIIDETFGAWYIGSTLATVCFGLFILQCWLFLQRWQEEQVHIKAFVAFLLLLNVVQIICLTSGIYHYLISSIGNPAALQELSWGFLADPWVTGLIVASTQFFYGSRLFYLNRSWILFILITLLDIAALVCGWVAAAFETDLHGTLVAANITQNLALAALACDLVCDIMIMFGMLHFLRKNRKLTTHTGTHYILSALVTYSFASGLATSIGALLTLIMFLALPKTQIYSAISFILPHLYSNSVLSLLNARQAIREKASSSHVSSSVLSSRALGPLRFKKQRRQEQSTSFALDTEIDFQGGKLHGSHDTAQIPLDNLTNKHEKVEVEEIVQSQKYPAP